MKKQGTGIREQGTVFRTRRLGRAASLPIGVLLLAGSAALAHASKDAQLPDWVTQAATDAPLKSEWRDAKAIVLLDDTLVTVTPDGKVMQRNRMVVKILRPQGREYAKPVAQFSKDERLISFHVWSVGPDGHRYAMKDSEYIETGDLGADEGVLYADARMKLAAPPGTDPGGTVAAEIEQQVAGYMTENTWSFQSDIPVVRSIYELDLPPGWHQEAVWSRHEKVPPTEVAPGHFRWEQTNIDGIDLSDVPLHPAWEAVAGRMTVHFSAEPLPEGDALWSRIGNWYLRLGGAAQ